MAAKTDHRTVPSWVRYGGLAAILASILEMFTSIFAGTLFPEALEPGTRDALVVGDIVVTYLVLGVVGIAAVYGRYGDELGLAGALGLVAIAVGAVIGIVTVVVTGALAGNLLNVVLVFGGAGLLAVGLWRIRTVPRSAPVLMGLTPVAAVAGIAAFLVAPESSAGLFAFLVVNVVWGLAWIVLGYHLWRSPRRSGVSTAAGSTRT